MGLKKFLIIFSLTFLLFFSFFFTDAYAYSVAPTLDYVQTGYTDYIQFFNDTDNSDTINGAETVFTFYFNRESGFTSYSVEYNPVKQIAEIKRDGTFVTYNGTGKSKYCYRSDVVTYPNDIAGFDFANSEQIFGGGGGGLMNAGSMGTAKIIKSSMRVVKPDGTYAYIPSMPDTQSSLICLQTFVPFRYPITGMPIQFEFTVPYNENYEYNSETCTITGTDSNATSNTTYQLESYPQMILNQEAGKVVGDFTINPYFSSTNTTADKKIKITLVTPTHTFQDIEFTIPTIVGFQDTNGDGLDDRDNKSQDQITTPAVNDETNQYIDDKPLRNEYPDGIIGDVQYGFANLMYYIEAPFRFIGNTLVKMGNWLSQSMTWVYSINAFFTAFIGFLPPDIIAGITVLVLVIIVFTIVSIIRGK